MLSTSVGTQPAAHAATTPVSNFTKTGIDQQNSSTANSASGNQGNAKSGDTVKWALNYQNKTGADANVAITDPITGSQAYVANSLQLPPGWTGNVTGNTVTANGSAPGGTTAAQSPNFNAAAVTFTTPGGDGYSVEGYGSNIYTVYHHNASATAVFCATLQNTVCPGWPGHSSYVSPTAGTPLGTGAVSTFSSNYVNGSFIANGQLYWSVIQNGATGTDVFGMQCLNLSSLVSCGYTQLGSTTVPGYGMSGDGIAAADGNYYYMDNNGFMQCVTPTATSCGAVDVAGTVVGHGGTMEVGTYGRYVYATYDVPPGTTNYITCFDTTTHAKCANYPKATGPFGVNFDSEVMPVVSSTGTFLGACAILNGACFDPSGNPIANPWSQVAYSFAPTATGNGFGTGVLVGTKYYTGHASVVDCYDFAQPLVGGKVQPCAAFTTHPSDVSSYTVRQLANLPGCMASNGDGAQISVFNATTGAPCASASQSVKLTPTDYYCDGLGGHVQSWGKVTLPGLNGSEYFGATLTLTDANGNPVPGWTNVPFPASGAQTLDISSIPVSGSTASLTATVNMAAVINIAAVNASKLQVSWLGDDVQVCYQTVMPPVPCLQTVPVSNTANAVTTASTPAGVISDAPAGNSSGPAIFNVTEPTAACMLHFSKTASPTPAKPGQLVTYTIVVHNTGTADYLAASPATFTDDITDTLADSTYGSNASATAGTVSYNAGTQVLSWSGPLAAGATATVTYTVTVDNPDTGDHEMVNRVVSSNPSNCPPGSTDPACLADVPISDLHVSKSSNPADGSTVTAGQVITYTLTFANTGKGTAAVDYTDDLTKVLDDATVTSAPTASNSALTASAVSGGQFTVTGAVPGNTTYTVTYQVTVNPDGQRGDNVLDNFVFPTGTTPPTVCVVGDPLCTEHKAPEIVVTKSSSPADGAPVYAGDVVTYTLSFQNIGAATGSVAQTDYLTDVLDDATVTSAPVVSNAALTVGPIGNGQFAITGTVPVGATYTVTYQITIKPYAQQGNHSALNFVAPTGPTPPPPPLPGPCVTDPTCVVHPIPHLSIVKTASTTARPAPGDTVSYTVTVTNDGGTDYTAANPASMTDDLTDVLDDATYNADAAASTGTVIVSGNQLTWSGALAMNATATITYSVTYTGAGSTVMTNTACVPKQGQDPNCRTVSVPAADILPSKSVSPANGSTVVAGQALTYTLTFDNRGQGAGDVTYTDDLSKVLDDATLVSGPTASNAALTVGRIVNGQFQVSGVVPGTTIYTVTYQVTVKPDGQRGDNLLDNFLVPTGTTPPAHCSVDDPLCTHNPVPEIVPTKTVDPASTTTVHGGDVLAYTLTFHNIGQATGSIDYIDHLTDVLDDATVTTQPSASNADLTASAVANGQFDVTGTVPMGATYTVTYQVTIKPDGQRGNDVANNFLVPKGGTPPTVCQPTDTLCTTNPMPDISSWKSVNPTSGTPVVPGQSLTYTLHFTNKGKADGTVNTVDDITQAIDDASVTSQPASSNPALSVTSFGPNHRTTITGTLAPGQTVTITYTLKVHAANKLGDSILANFLMKPTDPPPTSPNCLPTDPQLPTCTSNPVGLLAVTKTVDPKSFSDVQAGDTLTYTLTFTNVGKGAVTVDYTDHLAGVLDDATLVADPKASSSVLSASAVTSGAFRITGSLPGGQTVTVVYQVKVKAYDQQGDHKLGNFLDPTGHGIASECVSTDPLCTANPVPPPSPAPPPLASTGNDTQAQLILATLLVGAGALLSMAGIRRRRRTN
ncbi:MAG: hypothetical protein JWO57_3527 [Pseudonocardiales bacterium]|nr:hypothetical protein [Pseudonocardiales bacterium]